MNGQPSAVRHNQIKRLILDFHASEQCDPSYEDISFFCQVRPETIAKVLRRLEAFGEVRVRRNPGRRNQYIIRR